MAEEEDEVRESEIPPDLDEEKRRRLRLEKLLGGAIRRGLEAGIGTLSRTDDVVRGIVGENVKLPKELVGYIFSQVDETKNALVRVVAGEVRDFLQATDIATELQKALTSLSFEVKTEIRFIPNEAGGIKPEVNAELEPRRKGKKSEPPKKKRKTEPPPPPDEELSSDPDDDDDDE